MPSEGCARVDRAGNRTRCIRGLRRRLQRSIPELPGADPGLGAPAAEPRDAPICARDHVAHSYPALGRIRHEPDAPHTDLPAGRIADPARLRPRQLLASDNHRRRSRAVISLIGSPSLPQPAPRAESRPWTRKAPLHVRTQATPDLLAPIAFFDPVDPSAVPTRDRTSGIAVVVKEGDFTLKRSAHST